MTMDYEKYLIDWIEGFLSTPLDVFFGYPPCPFAKKALIENKIKFTKTEDFDNYIRKLLISWDNNVDVVCVICNEDIDSKYMVETVKKINIDFMPRGFICLEDHKLIPETINKISLNNGKYNIVLCQKLEKINNATKKLLNTKYYDNWPTDYFNEVVSWRFESALHKSM